jgi:hypothetical protein
MKKKLILKEYTAKFIQITDEKGNKIGMWLTGVDKSIDKRYQTPLVNTPFY